MSRRVLALLAVACLAAAGCSTEEKPNAPQPSGEGDQLNATDLATVAQAYKTIRAHCEGLADAHATDGAAAALVRVYRTNGPEAIADFNDANNPLNLRGALRDAASQLDRCHVPDAAGRLRRAASG